MQRLDHRELLDRLEHLALAAQARRVHQLEALAVALEGHGDRVARGAGHVEGDQPLLAQPGIDERGLAHIGPARHGELDHALVGLRVQLVRVGQVQGFQRQVDQAADALPVRGRHGIDLTQPQLVELGQLRALAHALGLVGGQHAGLAQAAQVVGDVVVLRRQPGAGIDYEDDYVSLCHSLLGLAGHLAIDAAGRIRLEAAGVDDDVLVLALLAIAVVPVTREPGEVRHDRVAGLGQAVEKRGFADVRAPHEGNDGFHRSYSGRKP